MGCADHPSKGVRVHPSSVLELTKKKTEVDMGGEGGGYLPA